MSKPDWALILGVSSGFGAAIAKELAADGYHICGVHLDMGPARRSAEELRQELERSGQKAIFFNVNAADAEKRTLVLDELAGLDQQLWPGHPTSSTAGVVCSYLRRATSWFEGRVQIRKVGTTMADAATTALPAWAAAQGAAR